MRIAYLTNQYPKVSHTFIRREIAALEAMGEQVVRYSVRPTPDQLIDADDKAEEQKTRVLLAEGVGRIGGAVAQVAARRPEAFARAGKLAAEVGIKSERGPILHGIYLAEACRLLQWCEADDVEHVHVHFGTNPATVAMLCRVLGGPTFSVTAHGPEEFDKPLLIRLRDKIEHSAFVAGVSDFGRGQLMRHCDYPQWPKLQVVRCGVEARYLERPIAPLPDVPRLLYVGRLSEQKGPLLLVAAAAALRNRGVSFELVLVGDGPLRGEVEDLIERHQLQDHVKLVGWASGDAVASWLDRSSALVLPSLAEGLPVVIMEALAAGRPVLSTYIAGIPELVRPDCGWLIPSGSVSHLTDAMAEVIATPNARLAEMGTAGRARVTVAHDVRKNARHLRDLIARVLSGQPLPDPLQAP